MRGSKSPSILCLMSPLGKCASNRQSSCPRSCAKRSRTRIGGSTGRRLPRPALHFQGPVCSSVLSSPAAQVSSPLSFCLSVGMLYSGLQSCRTLCDNVVNVCLLSLWILQGQKHFFGCKKRKVKDGIWVALLPGTGSWPIHEDYVKASVRDSAFQNDLFKLPQSSK